MARKGGREYIGTTEDTLNRIRIGTLVSMNDPTAGIKQIETFIKYGFESFTLTFWKTTGSVDLPTLSKKVRAMLDPLGIPVSAVSVFGNPLETEPEDIESLRSWERLIDAAPLFGCDMVSGFTGRLRGKKLEESIPAFRKIFTPLAERAGQKGVRIAFENCSMGGDWSSGDWNVAIDPTAWKLLFDAVPSPNIGLEWEPCHQLVRLIDPLPQLREWVSRVFHVHGKDATVDRSVLAKYGTGGSAEYAWHRTPGFGDTNWSDLITILMMGGYKGSIDIEGYHDPVFKGELELTGQVTGMEYLKRCRGGSVLEVL